MCPELSFKKLFEPISIAKVTIKNRLAMAPMSLTNLVLPEGGITERGVRFYQERAKGGTGLIITSVFKVENEIENLSIGGVPVWPLVTSHPKALMSLAELADYVHAYDSKVFVQLSAGGGRVADGPVIDEGMKPVSPSPTRAFWRPNIRTRALEIDEIGKIVDAFASAARILGTAEIDGVEIHGHEGYLIDQFTTSIWNRRTDEYGGDLKGRLRFPIEILKAIKGAVGKDFPVIYRMGVKHFIKGSHSGLKAGTFEEKGRDIKESKEVVQYLERAGYNGFHLDTGAYESWYWAHPPTYQEHGCNLDLMRGFKERVNSPILVAGKLDIPQVALKTIKDGLADMVAIGRGLLADPYLPEKIQEGRLEDIQPCVGGHIACVLRAEEMGRPLSCSVNPLCGREGILQVKPTKKPKKVLVAGGGVAGMEVARLAASRGHDVILYEKKEVLGGHLLEASAPDFKKDYKRLLDWYRTQIQKSNAKVVLNKAVTLMDIREADRDVIIVATGSIPIVPDVLGIDKPIVVTCTDLLLGNRGAGDSPIIVGAGLEGCETGVFLSEQGKDVTIVEKLKEPMLTQPVFKANRDMLLDMLKEKGVKLITNATLKEVTDAGIVVRSKNGDKMISGDTVILAMGLKADTSFYDSLRGEFSSVYKIGDCKEPRRVHEAIWEGFNIGITL